jgi:hypothetical protein
MATKKPVRRVAAPRPSDTLMGNQDLRHKGDSTARKKGKCVTFWVTDEQKQAISAYAADHGMTVSRLIIEGLEMRMNRESI